MAVDDRRSRGALRSLQVSAWRGDDRTVVLNPTPDRPLPTVQTVVDALDQLRGRGHHRAITGALHHHELSPFLAAGFVVHERLHLLRHELDALPTAPDHRFRRAGRRHREGLLALDRLAFDDFWTLDARGLDDAINATPVARVRVLASGGSVSAYAVTGRAGDRGYIQRLAVRPDEQRRGIGTALVADSLRWLRRRGAHLALVNTQERNTGALALYLACGFTPEPTGLTVLARPLHPSNHPGPTAGEDH